MTSLSDLPLSEESESIDLQQIKLMLLIAYKY